MFALAAFLGYQVISRVPPLLHTPLMSATNAISGISLIGSLVIAGSHYDEHQTLASILGCAAVTSAMINVTGGFLITDRMLKMFRKKEAVKAGGEKVSHAQYFLEATYLIASCLFVLGLKGLSHPDTARRGMIMAAAGMAAAVSARFFILTFTTICISPSA